MGLQSTIYNTVLKRTSTFVLACVGAAFFFERTVDVGAKSLFEKVNEGVRYIINRKSTKHIFFITEIMGTHQTQL